MSTVCSFVLGFCSQSYFVLIVGFVIVIHQIHNANNVATNTYGTLVIQVSFTMLREEKIRIFLSTVDTDRNLNFLGSVIIAVYPDP
jgi:hypothetical protein